MEGKILNSYFCLFVDFKVPSWVVPPRRVPFFLASPLHIVLTFSSSCLLGFPLQIAKSYMSFPLFIMQSSSALPQLIEVLNKKNSFMGKEIPSSQGNDILLFQLIGRVFHKRKLQQLTGIVLQQLITVPSLPTNCQRKVGSTPYLELRQQPAGLWPPFLQAMLAGPEISI